ncbi:DUF3788 family protein [bacterium]|nr:DUF3788 family protein [bacterium]
MASHNAIGEQLLRDQDEYPTGPFLDKALGNSYPVFEMFMTRIQGPDYRLTPEWRYYRDGKAWLCKISRLKKTIVWLSVWPGFFKTSLYFTEKTGTGIQDLDIDETIKNDFKKSKRIGKLVAFTMEINNQCQLHDLFQVIGYKLNQK